MREEIQEELKRLIKIRDSFNLVCESLRAMGIYKLEEPLSKIEDGLSFSIRKMENVIFPEEEE